MKKKFNVSNWINNLNFSMDEDEKRRRKYLEDRNAEKQTPKGQYTAKMRLITQQASTFEDDIATQYVQATEQLKNKIIELLQEKLAEEAEKGEISFERFKDILAQSKPAFEKLRIMCSHPLYISKKVDKRYTHYERLFNILMDEVDVRFALFAPQKSLTRKGIKFDLLPENLKKQMFNRISEMGLFENDSYAKAYCGKFKEYLGDVSDELTIE